LVGSLCMCAGECVGGHVLLVEKHH
jgi:hypothetical protein